MPKRPLDQALMNDLESLASAGRLHSLVIDRYKSGQHKGKLYANYTEGERTLSGYDMCTFEMIQIICKRTSIEQLSLQVSMMPNQNTAFHIEETIENE